MDTTYTTVDDTDFDFLFAEDEDGPDIPRQPINVGDRATHCVGGHRTNGEIIGKQADLIRFLPEGAVVPMFFDLRPNGMYWRYGLGTGHGGYLRFKKG